MCRAATTQPSRRLRRLRRVPRRIGRTIRALAEADPDNERSPMLLDKKTAIVYGAAGAIGSAVACAYAREGADVRLVAAPTEPAVHPTAHRAFRALLVPGC
jgi:hypothetical protein